MALPVPVSLSPSKVSAFTDCALAFRFSAIDRLPEPPSVSATRGTLVHAALERLFCRAPADRTPAVARECLDEALEALRGDPELAGLGLDGEAEAAFVAEAAALVERYFRLEDPTAIRPIGLELRLEAQVGGVRLRGVIDRLELDEDGELVVTDYKTGSVPGVRQEQARLGGVHFYALLCEEFFGRRPAAVQLLYLKEPVAIVARPSAQTTRGLRGKVAAVWRAVERACATEDFRPRPSHLCEWCSFRPWCPAWGGEPSAAKAELTAGQPQLTLT
jgi:putative RecB family exonuclease